MSESLFDVLIVGAGISGLGGAVHLSQKCPGKSFAILEGRDRLGGTWDLFKYPGIRSDSDMYTLGFEFKPWTEAKAIADAPAILNYLHETVEEYGLEKHIRFQTRVKALSWLSEDCYWSVTCEVGPEKRLETLKAKFLYMGTGYYSYTDPYRPEFAGQADFKGPVLHPQFWPETLDYQGKNVVIIGSGATAVTLIPAMADGGAGHMTMLQRSPSYIVSRPAEDKISNWLRATLPGGPAYALARWKNILMARFMYNNAQNKPEKAKEFIAKQARAALGDDYDIATHLTPSYNPWDQRMCLIPDNDMFRVMREGKAEIVTGQIERFTKTGIRLSDGRDIPADIIVTATGLKMEIMSGVSLTVDGEAVNLGERLSYKGFMYSGVPNLCSAFGYSNASWTLKADLIANYTCRLLNRMDETGDMVAIPDATGITATLDPMMNLSSGYVQRALSGLPKQGDQEPFKAHHNYLLDRKNLRKGPLDDRMIFRKGPVARERVEAEPEFAEAAE
jgi:monooxygenase